MHTYNWQQPDWPLFTFSLKNVEDNLLLFSEKVGRVSGIVEALPEKSRTEALVEIILVEAIKTSAIEGEYPNRKDILSSIRKNLGIHTGDEHIKDKSAEGLGNLMISVRKTYQEPLTESSLFLWHKMLLGENKTISVGKWRSHEDPMQVLSLSLIHI